MKELLLRFLSIVSFLLVLSCSVNPPIINDIDWDISVIKDNNTRSVYENLTVFVNYYDEDGDDDLESLFLIMDKSNIYWELSESNWDVKRINNNKWIGAYNLIFPRRDNIPREPLRVHLRDLAGESVEETIYITKKKLNLKEIKFPEIKYENSLVWLIGYDEGEIYLVSDGIVVAEARLGKGRTPFNDLFKQNAESFGSNLEFYVSVLTGDLTIKSGPWY